MQTRAEFSQSTQIRAEYELVFLHAWPPENEFYLVRAWFVSNPALVEIATLVCVKNTSSELSD